MGLYGTRQAKWIGHIVDMQSPDVGQMGHIVSSFVEQKAPQMVFSNTLGYSDIYEVLFSLHL